MDCAERSCQVALTRVGAGAAGVLWTVSFEVPADDLLLVAASVVSQLRGGYPGRAVRAGFPDLEVGGDDYREYLEARRSFELRDADVPLERHLERLAAVERSSPRFPAAYVLEAQIAHHQFGESRDPAALDRAFAAARRARELTPGDPQVLYLASTLELAGGRLDEAAAVLDELERLQPGEARVVAQRAWLEERRGHAAEALALMRTAVRRQPSWNHLFRLALMEKRQGDADAARRHLRESLERSPGDFRSQSLLAVVELSPDDPTAALNLADAELLLGRTAGATERYRRVLELVERPDAPSLARFLTVRAQAVACATATWIGSIRKAQQDDSPCP